MILCLKNDPTRQTVDLTNVREPFFINFLTSKYGRFLLVGIHFLIGQMLRHKRSQQRNFYVFILDLISMINTSKRVDVVLNFNLIEIDKLLEYESMI